MTCFPLLFSKKNLVIKICCLVTERLCCHSNNDNLYLTNEINDNPTYPKHISY